MSPVVFITDSSFVKKLTKNPLLRPPSAGMSDDNGSVAAGAIAAPEQVLVSRRVIDEKLIRECVVEDIEANETG